MAHSLTPTVPATKIPIPAPSKQTPLSFSGGLACHRSSNQAQDLNFVHRRNLALGLVGLVVGLSVDDRKAATAAGRRAPAPALPMEKMEPGISGLTAKVLASKKRKEAMKESIAKLREKGRPIQEPSQ